MHQRNNIRNELTGRVGHLFKLDPIRFDLRNIQNVVDDPQQMVSIAFNCRGTFRSRVIFDSPEKYIGKAQYGCHGCTDFVAHGGQEIALGVIGCLGSLQSHLQFGRPFDNAFFHVVVSVLQLATSRADLVEHVVETVAEHAQFVVTGNDNAFVEVVLLRDMLHRLHQSAYRFGEQLLQSIRHQSREAQSDGYDQENNPQRLRELGIDFFQVGQKKNGTDLLALPVDVLCYLCMPTVEDCGIGDVGTDRDRVVHGRIRRIGYKDLAVGVIEGSHFDRGLETQRKQHFLCRIHVVEFEGRGGVRAQNIGQPDKLAGFGAADPANVVEGQAATGQQQGDHNP